MGDHFASYSFDLPKPLLQLIFFLNRISLAVSLLLIFLHLRPPPPPPPPPPASQSRSIPSHQSPEPQPPSIKTLLPLVHFATLAADSPSPSCAVCLAEFAPRDEVRVLGNCRHVFHRDCIDRWIDADGLTCPLCRSPLLSSPEVVAEEVEVEEKGLIVEIFSTIRRIPFSINLFITNFVVDNYL